MRAQAIVVGAGTGKTRTLTCRLAYRVASGEIPAGAILAVTHSAKAAGEMRQRFLRLGVDDLEATAARRIHAAERRQLSHFWSVTGRPGSLNLCESPSKSARAALASCGVSTPTVPLVLDVLSDIEGAKSQLLAAGTLDYTDLLTEAAAMIHTDERVARTIRSRSRRRT